MKGKSRTDNRMAGQRRARNTGRPLRFIDLFAGIGGFRMAFEAAGHRCVFTSEWDRFARQAYEANFGDTPHGDVRAIEAADIPPFDLLCAGFPCQAFSIAGVSKKNALGREHGFRDAAQGTLFFEVARIIEHHRPTAFLLENVKNLLHHDRGRTYATIEGILKHELGYHLRPMLLSAATVLPQKRTRIYIAGFRDPTVAARFQEPELQLPGGRRPRLGDILESRVDPRYTLTDHLWRYLQDYKEKHRAAGNGFGFGLTGRNEIARTLSARYYKDGSEILIPRRNGNPRRLTPRECARLMGFPDSFQIVVSDTQAYKQFGNSVAVPVVTAIARNMTLALSQPVFSTARESRRPFAPARSA